MAVKRIILDWDAVNFLNETLVQKIRVQEMKFDAVAGVLPGGYVPAKLLAKSLGVPSALLELGGRKFKPAAGIESAVILTDQSISRKIYRIAESMLRGAGVSEIKEAAFVVYEDFYLPDLYSVKYSPVGVWPFRKPSAVFPWQKNSPLYEVLRAGAQTFEFR